MCNSTKQCHIDTAAEMPLTDTTLLVTTQKKIPKRSKENATQVPDAPENQLDMQEHPKQRIQRNRNRA